MSGSSIRQILPTRPPIVKMLIYPTPGQPLCSGKEFTTSLAHLLHGQHLGEQRTSTWQEAWASSLTPVHLPSHAGFWTFSKARWEKGVLAFNWWAALVWSVSSWKCLQHNGQSRELGEAPGSLHLSLWLQIPPRTRGWIFPFVFLSEVSADWFVKWLRAQMR